MTRAAHAATAGDELSAELLEAAAAFDGAPPELVLAWAFERFEDRIAIATGFGVEGMALVDLACRARRRPRVFFVDTDFLFPETYALRRRVEERYGIAIERVASDLAPGAQAERYGPELWRTDPDRCCAFRKVEPLRRHLAGLDAWVTAIRHDQTPARASARAVEWDARWGLVKINPLVAWTRADVWAHVRAHDVPHNPLHAQGFPSIGCTHCTRAVAAGEDERAGRWAGTTKTECGLHADR